MLTDTMLFWCARAIVGAFSNTMLDVNVEKRAPLPDGPKIIAANHPTTTDPFLVAGMLKKRSYLLIMGEIFEIPVVGACLRSLGHIAVNTGSGQAAIDRSLELLRRGETVVIFPEGKLSPPEGGFNSARSGVARLALASVAPVIPVGIYARRKRISKLSMNRSGEQEASIWCLRGPYYMTTGSALHFQGNVENRNLVRDTSSAIMHNIIELAYLSQQRIDQTPPALFRQPA